MTRKAWVAAAIAAALLGTGATAQDANSSKGRTVRTDAETLAADKIVLVGDSTMAPMSGWASMFCAHHVKSSTACLNLGRGGRSTRSYRQEGSWDLALAEARVPGYRRTFVLIQFGHNDQSSVAERWTEMDSEFPANLRRMVEEVRQAGAVPALLTPLTRRDFVKGRLNNTLEPWAAKVRAVAAALKVPLVDLNAASAAAVQEMGPVRSMALAQTAPNGTERDHAGTGTTLKARPAAEARLPDVPTTPDGPRGQFQRKFDYTHLGDEGAELFAGLVARDLARAVPELRSQIAP
ncbi:rhamnogalacturonan acetylesterase [Novosphingobium resinovorum]|uniref:rhamnogalacturonan acetylesterase n=1 Tax=Novosphingobium TaxID=165696 RepID=UPI001B3C78D5|nr:MULTISPECIES: rhamnogalacturonan acetylesterase [Novosphingobium]MBF7010623.1 rhamnogalacturonan acetylesterase [Novosphingobium sp. HR1a]WJM28621.1 rhamnogalacturonan acetylesterase [Novosphingobium resinovorum]